MAERRRLLHVEVGGAYGGSLRALETYLCYSDRARFLHHVLFYYPTPGAGRLRDLAETISTLHASAPEWLVKPKAERGPTLGGFKRSPIAAALREGRAWARLLQDLPTVVGLYRLFAAGRYHLIHVNNTFPYQAPTLVAARLAHIPVLAHVRNPVPPSLLNRRLAHLVSALATVSRNYEKELASWCGPLRIRTCYDGVEPPVADESAAQALRSSMLGDGKVLVGSAGRLDQQKGYEHLLRAARQVLDRRSDVRFAIAGEGPLRPRLEGLVTELNLTGYVQLCGFRPDVASFLGALDLFVCSSLWEGLPIAVLEAMMLGKPVVATDVGGLSEAVVPGQTGLLVPPGQPDALAAGLLQALELCESRQWPHRHLRQLAAHLTEPRASAWQLDQLAEEVLGLISAVHQPGSRSGRPAL